MKLYAISDLHLSAETNRRALREIGQHRDDWLILAGDVGETEDHLELAFRVLAPRFRRLIWVPGNHELWTVRRDGLRGDAKYRSLVALCRSYDVLTPEDPFQIWSGEGGAHVVAPLFLLYDYTFAPDHVPPEKAAAWAEEAGVSCADEHLLHPDPFATRADWCHARCDLTSCRLEQEKAKHGLPFVLVNHFPLRRSLAWLPAIPRFRAWCGTRLTEDWHTRFGASAVVSGHLHIRNRVVIDGCRFEEVSLGYPSQWRNDRPIETYLRQILPAPPAR